MSSLTDPSSLRQVRLLGPRVASGSASNAGHLWVADLAVAYAGSDKKDTTLVSHTHGLRVELQSVSADTVAKTAWPTAAGSPTAVAMHTPELLVMVGGPDPAYGDRVHFVAPSGFSTTADTDGYQLLRLPDPSGGAASTPPGWTGSQSVQVVPADAWPMPQSGVEIQVPRLRLVHGGLRALVDVRAVQGEPAAGLLGLLGLKPSHAGDHAIAFAGPDEAEARPHLRLPWVGGAAARRVEIELRPDGIAFDARVRAPDMENGAERWLSIRFCLRNHDDPLQPGQDAWSLSPIADLSPPGPDVAAYGVLRQVLRGVNRQLRRVAAAISVTLDAGGIDPPVRWPLIVHPDTRRLALLETEPASLPGVSRLDWALLVEAASVETTVAGEAAEGGSLPTAMSVAADRVLLCGSPGQVVLRIDADRHANDIGLAIPTDAAAPVLHLDWPAGGPRSLRLEAAPALAWRFDETAFASELALRYRQAGVHPDGARLTYAYFPIARGWLQWPLRLPEPPGPNRLADPAPASAEPARFAAALEFAVDTVSTPPAAASGRRVRLDACDRVALRLVVATTVTPVRIHCSADFHGAAGVAQGVLWYAASSPTAEEILPGLQGGSSAVRAAVLRFGSGGSTDDRLMSSGPWTPNDAVTAAFELRLWRPGSADDGATGAVAWRAPRGMPVVSALPMTRTVEASHAPMTTRNLLPWRIETSRRDVMLRVAPGDWLPTLVVAGGAAGEVDVLLGADHWLDPDNPGDTRWRGVPMVAVTLPGVEFEPAPGDVGDWRSRLRYEPPLLDEMHALARLPPMRPSGPSSASGAPTAAPAAASRPPPLVTSLDLDALQIAWQRANAALALSRTQDMLLFERWVAPTDEPVSVDTLFSGTSWQTRYTLSPVHTGLPFPFGSYRLGPMQPCSGGVALAGLRADFSVAAGRLTTPVQADGATSSGGAGTATPLRILGGATPLWRSDPSGPWRDTRGTSAQATPVNCARFLMRAMESAMAPGAWERVTLRSAAPLASMLGQRQVSFWFKDLPMRGDDASGWLFDPCASPTVPGSQEAENGPSQDAFNAVPWPSNVFEWRLANDPGPAAAHGLALPHVDLGLFRFRPARLLRVEVTPGQGVGQVQVLGSLGFVTGAAAGVDAAAPVATNDGATSGANVTITATAPKLDAFGPDDASGGDNPVVLTLGADPATPDALTVTGWRAAVLVDDAGDGPPRWQLAAPDARPTLHLYLPALALNFAGCRGGEGRAVPAWLTLDLDGSAAPASPQPGFSRATLALTLFGQPRLFESGEFANADPGGALTVIFSPQGAAAGSGFLLTGLTLRLTPQGGTAELEGSLTLTWIGEADDPLPKNAPAPPGLVNLTCATKGSGASLQWLNLSFGPGEFTISADHAEGVIRVATAPAATAPATPALAMPALATPLAPIDGLAMSDGIWQGELRLVVGPATPPKPKEAATAAAGAAAASPGKLDGAWFAVRSLFGELVVSTIADPPPLLRRLSHRLVAPGGDQSPTLLCSEILVDLGWSAQQSLFDWPVGALPHWHSEASSDGPAIATRPLQPLYSASASALEVADLEGRVNGRALRGTLVAPSPLTLGHQINLSVAGLRLPTSCLGGTPERWTSARLARPWTFHAVVQHTVRSPGDVHGQALKWSTLDQVVAVGSHAFLAAAAADLALPAQVSREYAFAAHYRDTTDAPAKGQGTPGFVKAGIGLRAYALAGLPVAALAAAVGARFSPGGAPVVEELLFHGAGPAAIADRPKPPALDPGLPVKAGRQQPRALYLSLPWLSLPAASQKSGSFGVLLGRLPQLGAAPCDWDAPDIDWAAGVKQTLAERAPSPLVLTSDDAGELQRALARVFAGERATVDPPAGELLPAARALMPVEQVFLRPTVATSISPDSISSDPLWLRSLIALATLYLDERGNDGSAPLVDRVRCLLPAGQGDGRFCTLRLQRRTDDAAQNYTPAQPAELVVLGRESLRIVELAAADTPLDSTDSRLPARLMALAEGLVSEPVEIVLRRRPLPGGRLNWAPTPPRLAPRDDAHPGQPAGAFADRVYASPALGWPTARGVTEAARGALAMGDDRPFQDTVVPGLDAPVTEPVQAGTGLSGRVASIALPARAGASGEAGRAVYYLIGRKTVYSRLDASMSLLAPPVRQLNAASSGLRLPASTGPALWPKALGTVLPLIPPFIQRTGIGMRPGALQAELDMLVVSDGDAAISPLDPNLGMPGHGGPVLTRQLRYPRGVDLPRLPLSGGGPDPAEGVGTQVETHGRRTFVAVDDLLDASPGWPTPFRLLAGAATLLRTVHPEAPQRRVSLRVRVADEGLDAESVAARLVVTFESPSLTGAQVITALGRIGLIRDASLDTAQTPPTVSLQVDARPFAFDTLRWRSTTIEKLPGMASVELLLTTEALAGDLSDALDAIDGDGAVTLIWTSAPLDPATNVAPECTNASLRSMAAGPAALAAATTTRIVMRLATRSTRRPSVAVPRWTLVFADPSYDRELAGPGASVSQRDTEGRLWKLAADRFEYGSDTPVFFGFGRIVQEHDGTNPPQLAGRFDLASQPAGAKLSLRRVPADAPSKSEPLTIDAFPEPPYKQVLAACGYGFSVDRLRDPSGLPAVFGPGDLLSLNVEWTPAGNTAPVSLTLLLRWVNVPVIPTPPCVYSLVASEAGDPETADVWWHASRPLPTRIEFVDLIGDLAQGHVRRNAMFESAINRPGKAAGKITASLVKMDASGSAQLPDLVQDMIDCAEAT